LGRKSKLVKKVEIDVRKMLKGENRIMASYITDIELSPNEEEWRVRYEAIWHWMVMYRDKTPTVKKMQKMWNFSHQHCYKLIGSAMKIHGQIEKGDPAATRAIYKLYYRKIQDKLMAMLDEKELIVVTSARHGITTKEVPVPIDKRMLILAEARKYMELSAKYDDSLNGENVMDLEIPDFVFTEDPVALLPEAEEGEYIEYEESDEEEGENQIED